VLTAQRVRGGSEAEVCVEELELTVIPVLGTENIL
jgi:hypothetical protein